MLGNIASWVNKSLLTGATAWWDFADLSPLKADMSRMGLELSQSLERCRIDANEKIKNEEIRSKSIEVEYNSLRTRYENEKLTQQEREFQYKSQIDQSTRYIKDLEEKNQILTEGKAQFIEIVYAVL